MLLGQKVFISSFVKIAIEWDIYMDGESLSHLLRKTNYKIHIVFAWKIKNIRKFEVRNKDNLRFFSVFDFYLRFFWFFLRSGNPSPHVARVFQPRSYRRQRQLAWYDEAICTWFISILKQLFEDRTRQPELQTHNSFEDQKRRFFRYHRFDIFFECLTYSEKSFWHIFYRIILYKKKYWSKKSKTFFYVSYRDLLYLEFDVTYASTSLPGRSLASPSKAWVKRLHEIYNWTFSGIFQIIWNFRSWNIPK